MEEEPLGFLGSLPYISMRRLLNFFILDTNGWPLVNSLYVERSANISSAVLMYWAVSMMTALDALSAGKIVIFVIFLS